MKKIIIQNELMLWAAVLTAGEGLLITLVFSVAASFSGLPGECSLLTEKSRVPVSVSGSLVMLLLTNGC